MSPTGVVLPYWPDRPPLEALDVASLAERAGYDELWVGEMATFDAFAIASAIAVRTDRIHLTIGPLAVAVRDPVALALGIASVSELGGRPAGLALGVSTPTVVSSWHGRSWEQPVARLEETVAAIRPILEGEKAAFEGKQLRAAGFRLRLTPPRSPITVAAFGDASIRIAARAADRMVINLVTAEQAKSLRDKLEQAAADADRSVPPLAAWVVAAVDPTEETLRQIAISVVQYLAAPGYGEMFAGAGFRELVERARAGAHPKELLSSTPVELLQSIAAIGDESEVRRRIAEYESAGVDDVAIVPATAGEPDGGARTIEALAPPGQFFLS